MYTSFTHLAPGVGSRVTPSRFMWHILRDLNVSQGLLFLFFMSLFVQGNLTTVFAFAEASRLVLVLA